MSTRPLFFILSALHLPRWIRLDGQELHHDYRLAKLVKGFLVAFGRSKHVPVFCAYGNPGKGLKGLTAWAIKKGRKRKGQMRMVIISHRLKRWDNILDIVCHEAAHIHTMDEKPSHGKRFRKALRSIGCHYITTKRKACP